MSSLTFRSSIPSFDQAILPCEYRGGTSRSSRFSIRDVAYRLLSFYEPRSLADHCLDHEQVAIPAGGGHASASFILGEPDCNVFAGEVLDPGILHVLHTLRSTAYFQKPLIFISSIVLDLPC